MKRRHWQVWLEDENGNETILFSGSHAKCLTYYKSHGGGNAGLHIGYPLEEE